MNAPEASLTAVGDAGAGAGDCFHCGLPVPPETRFHVVVDGAGRRLCCHGCEAVAQAIVRPRHARISPTSCSGCSRPFSCFSY